MQTHPPGLADFLAKQHLPRSYAKLVTRWFVPLANELAGHQADSGRALLVGITGSQGSGKSTLAALMRWLLGSVHGLRAIDLSLDDFYLPRAQRQRLGDRVHPLLVTRGVPGTHDIPLLRETLDRLAENGGPVAIPRFDKAVDERVPDSRWQRVEAPLDVILLEGWCLGTPPQPEDALSVPVNPLEAREDPEGRWRRYVNRQIIEHYEPLYARIDIRVMLQAPSFDCVYRWRLEQERKLGARIANGDPASAVMNRGELARFIQHFQRLTLHTLGTLPARVHYLFDLDNERNIRAVSRPNTPVVE